MRKTETGSMIGMDRSLSHHQYGQSRGRRSGSRKGTRSINDYESTQWRASLQTAFVSNLSWGTTTREIWREFSAFGVVVDVYIPTFKGNGRKRYAFVRYRFLEELRRAILAGNRLIIAGRRIWVSQAKKRETDWRNHGNRAKGSQLTANRRSYEGVVKRRGFKGGMGADSAGRQKQVDSHNAKERTECQVSDRTSPLLRVGTVSPAEMAEAQVFPGPQNHIEAAGVEADISDDTNGNRTRKEMILDLNIPAEDIAWLFRSAIGYLREGRDPKAIQRELRAGGMNVLARRMGGLKTVLTFPTEVAMKGFTKFPPPLLQKRFHKVIPWVMIEEAKSAVLWVKLTDVPLELWHPNFFKGLGNNWGEFLALDESTEKQLAFDIARLCIYVKDRFKIPKHVAGTLLGVQFHIHIEVEEVPSEEEALSFANAGAAESEETLAATPTAEIIHHGEGQAKGDPLGNGARQDDDPMTTAMMSLTARRAEQGMGTFRLHNVDFPQLCMAAETHGEKEFPQSCH